MRKRVIKKKKIKKPKEDDKEDSTTVKGEEIEGKRGSLEEKVKMQRKQNKHEAKETYEERAGLSLKRK